MFASAVILGVFQNKVQVRHELGGRVEPTVAL